ncbi:hypothetical protein [Corynebacterium stationis]|uniref:Uncharacterized protein n=1 Tax=Corynebacterium stationis TaxID=1705 RepID=A0AB36CL70_9CORY|nr:hypothetical protein [Corynebacterium stationis]NME89589.1 hypothetical protein [Corynebacterium stationis]
MRDIIKGTKQLLDGVTPGEWQAADSDIIEVNSNRFIATVSEYSGLDELSEEYANTRLIAAAPELAQALAEETYEYQVQTRTPRMPTWSAITDDTLQKWYPEDKYNDLIRSKQGSGWVEVRALRRRVSPPEVINE